MGSGPFRYQKGYKTLYIVGKLIPWEIKTSVLTLVKVSFEGVTALLRRVTVTCNDNFSQK